MRTIHIAFKSNFIKAFIVKAFMVWVLFIPVAFINGFVRELLYKPAVGELLAHQINSNSWFNCFFGACLFYASAANT